MFGNARMYGKGERPLCLHTPTHPSAGPPPVEQTGIQGTLGGAAGPRRGRLLPSRPRRLWASSSSGSRGAAFLAPLGLCWLRPVGRCCGQVCSQGQVCVGSEGMYCVCGGKAGGKRGRGQMGTGANSELAATGWGRCSMCAAGQGRKAERYAPQMLCVLLYKGGRGTTE